MDTILTIAGYDPSGAAGISADLSVISKIGFYGISVITNITAQNITELTDITNVPTNMIKNQLKTLLQEFSPKAIKIGMVGTSEIAELLTTELKNMGNIPIVYDPVLKSSSGNILYSNENMSKIQQLISQCTLITPNIYEASILSGIEISNVKSANKAAKILLENGANSVLITGGHLNTANYTKDILLSKNSYNNKATLIKGKKHKIDARGTGCRHSTLVACYLAKKLNIEQACKKAKQQLTRWLSNSTINTKTKIKLIKN